MDFGVLGPLLVQNSNGPVVLGSAKQRTLLASLLLQRPGLVVSTDRLIDDLWGERPPQSGAKALQVQISHLRRALGPGNPILTRPRGYALDVDASAVDLHRFEAHLAQARQLRERGDRLDAIGELDAALQEWRGPALSDVTLLGPSAPEASRLNELRMVAWEERIQLQLEGGAAAALVPELEAMVAEDPYREHLHELLMLALYRAGRQADALEAFRRARKLLIDDLGLDPSPELVRLEAAILAQDPALAPVPASEDGRDRDEAEVRASSPAVSTEAEIPQVTGPILGREAELAAALELIESPEVRLLTLTGTGGIGKTRLAVELARRLRERSRLVELAPISGPERVVPAIAAAVGAEEATEAAVAAVLGGSCILFLDNFEHVLGAAPAVSSLLRAAPTLTVVVTSRAPLHVLGERELAVPPLERSAAAELFVERAREQTAGFSAGPADQERIAAICARLDGLPLAIELAAARTRILAPEEILDRIGRRLDLLTAGRRDAPERHRTLRTTIAWSYELLDASEQQLFAELAVFASGWSIEACEAVAEGPVVEALSSLVDHGLVIRDRTRFRMLETVREFAAEQLDASEDADTVRQRHAMWCVDLAETAETELGGADQADWFARLSVEQENLRTAASWALEHGEPEIALRLDGALWRFWLARGGYPAARESLTKALASGRGNPALRAKALNAVGVMAGEAMDDAAAQEFLQEALKLATQVGDRRQEARALMNLGVIATFSRDYATALTRYAKAGKIWQELGEPLGQSIMCQNQAIAREMLGQIDQVVPLLEESVALARSAKDGMHLAQTLVELGKHLLRHRSDDPRVPAVLHEGLQLLNELGEQRQVFECLEVVSTLGARSGSATIAAELIGSAEAERQRAGVRHKMEELPTFDATVDELQELLGEEAYEAARRRGAERDRATAVAIALSLTERLDEPAAPEGASAEESSVQPQGE